MDNGVELAPRLANACEGERRFATDDRAVDEIGDRREAIRDDRRVEIRLDVHQGAQVNQGVVVGVRETLELEVYAVEAFRQGVGEGGLTRVIGAFDNY